MALKRNRLSLRVVEDLKKRSILGTMFYPVLLFLVLLPGGYYERHPVFSLQLTVYVLSICIFRFIHWPVTRWMGPRYAGINTIIFLCSVTLTGLAWGIGFAKFVLQQGEFHANLLMTISTAGLSAGAAVAFLPYLQLGVVYCATMLMPAFVMMLSRGTNFPLATAVGLMFLYLCFMTFRGNREYWDALNNEHLLEEKSRELEKISRIDGLTELYNRRYFDEVYEFEWQRSIRERQPLTVVIADIDYFKNINDKYGHLAGDEFLKSLALMLKQVFKRRSDVVARYGGEEFIILMPGASTEAGVILAEMIRQKMAGFEMKYEDKII